MLTISTAASLASSSLRFIQPSLQLGLNSVKLPQRGRPVRLWSSAQYVSHAAFNVHREKHNSLFREAEGNGRHYWFPASVSCNFWVSRGYAKQLYMRPTEGQRGEETRFNVINTAGGSLNASLFCSFLTFWDDFFWLELLIKTRKRGQICPPQRWEEKEK